MKAPFRLLSRNIVVKRDDEDVSKTSAIAIAAVGTVLVVAFIAGCVFLFIRRRSRKNKSSRHGKSDSIDRSANSLHDPVSKTPLIRQESQSQMSEYQNVPAPRYDEEDDIGMAAPDMHRTMSGGSMRSLPPSYTAATHASVARTMSQNSHRPGSSHNGSDGLRPLMLLSSRQSYDSNDDPAEERGRSGYPAKSHRSSLVLPLPIGRPRAGSRFTERDMDM